MLRALLWVVVGIAAARFVAGVVGFGLTSGVVGRLLWYTAPGTVAAVAAVRFHGDGRGRRGTVVAVVVLLFWRCVAALGQGSPTGITGLVLPIAMVVLLRRADVRAYLSR